MVRDFQAETNALSHTHTHTNTHADAAKPTPSPTPLNHCQHSSSLGSVLPTSAQWGKENGQALKVESSPNTLTIPVVFCGFLHGDFFGSRFSLRNSRVTPTHDLEAGVQVHAAPTPLADAPSTNPSPSPGRAGRTGRFFAAATHFLETGTLQAAGAGEAGAIHVASACAQVVAVGRGDKENL